MEVKGSGIIVLYEFIKTNFGMKNLNLWLNSLPKEAKEVYSKRILVSSWYSLKEFFVEPTRKMCELFYNKDLKGAREVGRFSAEYGLKRFYSSFLRTNTPQALVKRASQIFSTYYRPCVVEAEEKGEKKILVRIKEFPEMDEIVENRILGWIERAIEIWRGKNVQIKIIKSLVLGDSFSEFEISWE
ncbi:MAG: hypothetical protein ABIN61_05640 [candidate division WOR-3 bacterium]